MATDGPPKRQAKRPRAVKGKPVEQTLADFKPTFFLGRVSTMGLPSDEVAQSYMQFILFRVTVILERRRWRVGVLKEFFPRGQSLLGLNVARGQEVCVRFRIPGHREQFLPFHEVLCTTLHELAHCVHSRHDKVFWALYYDLVKECEALEVRMVEQGLPLYPPAAVSAPPSAAGALAGRHLITGSASVGHRLGAAPNGGATATGASAPPTTPEGRRQLLAAAAALRRQPRTTPEGEHVLAPTSSAEGAPDDIPSTPPEACQSGWQCPRCTFWNSSADGGQCAMCGDDEGEDGAADGDADLESGDEKDMAPPAVREPRRERDEERPREAIASAMEWACARCTFLNDTATTPTTCEMCGAPRPSSSSAVAPARVESPASVVIISDGDE